MNLRYVVPALGLIAFTTASASAADGVTIGGFVDTIYSITDTEEDGAGTDVSGFSAATEIRLGYKVGEQVAAQVDVEWNNNASDASAAATGNTHGDVYLEQAYVNWAFADTLSLTTGKFTTYAGWVAADADGLYRINAGPIVALYGGELVGAALNWAPSDDLGISFFLVNGLDLLTDDSTNSDAGGDQYVSPAVDLVYKVADLGTFNVEAGYNYEDPDITGFSIGVNATIKPKAYEALTAGAEVIIASSEDDTGAVTVETDAVGVMLMANHTVPTSFPSSVTLMGQMLTVDNGTTEPETMELAAAWLSNPTGDAKFGVNAEVAYTTTDPDTGADDINSLAVSFEAIAVIP